MPVVLGKCNSEAKLLMPKEHAESRLKEPVWRPGAPLEPVWRWMASLESVWRWMVSLEPVWTPKASLEGCAILFSWN